MRLTTILLTMIFLAAFVTPACAMLHPGQGRFVQRDPLGYVDSMDLLQSRKSSPHQHLDSSGASLVQCPPGTTLQPRPGYGPYATNPPCGTADNPWPSSPPGAGGADFAEACSNHDGCYGTCGQLKTPCDDKFRQDMYAACDTVHPAGPQRDDCHDAADVYYTAVTALGPLGPGNTAHTNSQKEACICAGCIYDWDPLTGQAIP